jgi:hypothetical protein
MRLPCALLGRHEAERSGGREHMKALAYVLLLFLVIGCWVVWQVLRRVSAGTQAMIDPERYAIHKVDRMRQGVFGQQVLEPKDQTLSKWQALVRYDPEISEAAGKLRPYGEEWVERCGEAYFSLEEDRKYLPHIVRKLIDEAEAGSAQKKAEVEQAAAQRWERQFSRLQSGEMCTKESLKILEAIEAQGYALTVDDSGTISVEKRGKGTSYLRSNEDIKRFHKFS